MKQLTLSLISLLALHCLFFACNQSPGERQPGVAQPTPSQKKEIVPAENLSLVPVSLPPASGEKQACEQVLNRLLDKLYEAGADFRREKPGIVWVPHSKKGGEFWSNNNVIRIEKKAYDACRSFGKDSLTALAFLVGHELAHFYLDDGKHPGNTAHSFADHHLDNAKMEEEIKADLQGIFLAQVAGYQNLRKLLPQIVERIYQAYGWDETAQPDYPAQQVRQGFAEVVQQRADTLFHVFQAGTYLTGFGNYPAAAACFEHLLRFYNGSEAWNNLGVLYALQAMQVGGKSPDSLWYLFEIETQTRLNAVRSNLDEAQRRERQMLLEKSLDCFTKAAKMNPRSEATHANALCVRLLAGQGDEVQWLLERGGLPLQKDLKKLLLALAKAQTLEGKAEALALLRSVENSSHQRVALFARLNIAALQSKQSQVVAQECRFTPERYPDGVSLADLEQQKPGFTLDERAAATLGWQERAASTLYVFHLDGVRASFQVIHKPTDFVAPEVQVGLIFRGKNDLGGEQLLLPARMGRFWGAAPCKLVVRTGKKEKIEAWALAHR